MTEPQDFNEIAAGYTDYNGVVNLEALVRDAENPDHPAHRFFDWEEDEVTRKDREAQAQRLIDSVLGEEDEED